MTKTLSSALAGYETTVFDIMTDICNIFDANAIVYTINDEETEIVVADQTKQYIQDLIQNSLSTPKPVISILIDMIKAKDRLFIRKRIQ